MVGRNIRTARVAMKLSQSELAGLIGVNSGQIVSDWERGVYGVSQRNLMALCETLDRDSAWFYTEHGPDEKAA